jgi:hypothetical protein
MIRMKTHNRHLATLAPIFAALALLLATRAPAQSISLTASTGYQTAIALSYSSPVITGNNLSVTVQITNTSGTWVYLQQDQTYSTNSPVVLPYTVYLLGPGASKAITNVNFVKNTYLQFNVTTPIGLDFTTLATDPKPRALFGALIVDCMTRGLLTFPLPANAFDEPFNSATGVVDPVLDSIVSTLQQDGSSLGSAAVDLKNRDWVKLSVDFGQIGSQIASESSTLQNSISQILQRSNVGLSSGQVGTFFNNASTWLGVIAEVLDLPAKYTMLHDLSISTFGAPTTSWNRFDSVFNTPAPFISSVSPSSFTGLPLPQTQLIRIYGSGFTTNSTLIFNSTTPSDATRLTFINSSEIDYLIRTDTNAATWFVMVIDGSQFSNLSFFSVTAPPTSPTGSLVVNLSPAAAVTAGAQWQVDGTGFNNSGQTVAALAPGSHSVTFKAVSGYTTPTSFSVNIVANAQTTTNATYSAVAATTYTLTLNAASGQGSITPSPIGSGGGNTFTYNSGSLVQLTATAATGYHFTNWTGDASGTVNPTTITLSGNKNVTANFATGDPNLGTISVTIQPAAAITAGAQWKFNSSGWTSSGGSYNTPLLGANQNYLQFSTVAGWITPSPFYVTVGGGQTTNVTVTYQQDMTPGLLTVTLSPPDAVTAGAHWHVNGGTYGNGASVSLTPNNYTVTFDTVSGWTAPASQSVTMLPSQTKVLAGNYTPPAGQPAIGSVSPPIGPMPGGTLMTINGANFTAPATVLIGGQQASNVSVANATQITCLTPPGLAYGSTNVVVQTSGGSATNLNGFAYGIARGSKLDLISAIGGSCFGIAVQGNYAFVGEGRNVLALDISTPSNPSRIGKVTLPGIVKGIAILNQYAYVADYEGGLQVVDISTPATPRLAGYYGTTNQLWSAGISIYGGRAYIADETAGLQVFDLSNPTVPNLLSSTNLGGGEAVIVKASVNGVFAYFSTGGSLCIVDVSNPLSPALRGQTSINNGSAYSLAMNGNYVYAAALYGNLEIIDVSNTNTPVDVGHAPTIIEPSALAYSGGYLYAASSLGVNTLYVFSPSGSSLTLLGKTTATTASYGYNLAVSGTKVYAAGGSAGFEVVDVSNPYSPSLLTAFTDSGVFRQFNSVAVTGNAMPACGYPEGTLVGFNTIFDVSTPSAPTFAANPNAAGSSVLAKNGIAYVLAGNSNLIFNVTTPSSPQLLKLFNNTVIPGICMALSGNTLFIGGYSSGNPPCFAVVDVSTPSSPVIRSTTLLSGFGSGGVTSIAVNGNKAFVGMNGSNVVAVLDVSNLSAPVVVGSYGNLPYYPKGIQMSPDGSYGYVLSGNPSILYIFNLTQSANPTLITNIALDVSGVTDLKVQGTELFASTYRGLYVFDISSPSTPVLTRNFVTLSEVQSIGFGDLVSQSGYVYLSTLDGGIVILREQDIQAPNIYITDPVFGNFWTSSTSTLNLGGGSDDNVGVTAITWANDRGGSGQVSPPLDSWYVSGIKLYPGTNNITATAFDSAGNSGNDVLTVVYPTTNQNQTIIFPPIVAHTFGDAPIMLDAAASSGLPVTFSVVSGPATLTSSNVLALNGAGTVTVQASQPGNNSFNPAPSTNVSFTVALANQAITFAPIPTKAPTDAPFALTATTSSGLPVYFSVLSGPAGINSSNYVTLVGAGTVSILAWQPGNSNYNAAASVQQSFTISQIPQTIAFGALSQQRSVDAPFPIYASASSGLPVNLSVLSGPAQLSGNVLKLTGAGTVTVRASQAGSSVFAPAANVDQSLTVLPPSNTVGSPQYNVSGFNLTFYGTVGSNYLFQASSNLVNWTSLQSFTCTNSIMNFQDTSATGMAHRFYQIKPQ